MNNNKKQHYVPEFYLKAWCDPNAPQGYDPYIWIAPKNGSDIRRKAPSNIFHETDLYTIVDNGKRNLSIEKSLAQIEGEFSEVRRNKLEKQTLLDDHDILVICTFAAAMYSRTLANGERWKPFWSDLANQIEDKSKTMTEWLESASAEQIKALIPAFHTEDDPTVTFDGIKQIADEPLKFLISTQLKVLIPLFLNLNFSILNTTTIPGFITSDDPCVWFDAQLPIYPHLAGPALVSPTTEIHLPLSPSQCIYFNRQGKTGYVNLSKLGLIKESTTVTEINRRIRTKSSQYFIVNKEILLAKWFTDS